MKKLQLTKMRKLLSFLAQGIFMSLIRKGLKKEVRMYKQ